jgi:imidazolonepropionase-like amidohydrolase
MWQPSFSEEEMTAVVREAHRFRRKAVVHSLCAEATAYAIAARADEIEHAGFFTGPDKSWFDQDVAQAIAQSRIPVCTTISSSSFVKEAGPPDADFWRDSLQDELANAAALHRLGIPLLAGSDAGWRWSPFNAIHTELQLMNKAGLTPMECIVAATGRAAEALGLKGVTGTIKVGLSADLVAVQGRPDQDLHTMSQTVMVMKEGCYHRYDGGTSSMR